MVIKANMCQGVLGGLLAGALAALPAFGQEAGHRAGQVRAIVKASAEATISVDISARVRRMKFRAGQAFAKGDNLVEFDCARFEADFRSADAAFRVQAIKVKNNRQLLKHSAIGANELAVSVAEKDQARAVADVRRLRAQQCRVKAPFSGRVVERLIHEFETPGANTPLLKIVDTGPLELTVIVPSGWLVWLKRGQVFQFTVDETKMNVPARVVRLGAVVDAVSQTMRITGVFTGKSDSVLPGMSGTATFARPGS